MKKLLLVSMLVATGMTGNLFAQNTQTYYVGKSKTDQLFDVGRLSSLRHRFVIWLKNGNSVNVQVTNKDDFEKLLNLDSVVRAVAKNLVVFKDSLQDEITQKRIDYLNDAGGLIKVRIRQYRPNGSSFVLETDGPALLKIEQDTLNIIGYQSKEVMNRPAISGIEGNAPYQVSVLINDINKLESLADGTLNKVMNELKEQWDDLNNWSPKNNNKSNLYAYYNTTDLKLNRPMKNLTYTGKWIFAPYVQLGLQNVSNILTGSAGAGFELTHKSSTSFEFHYQLFWEPYFFFDKEPDNKFTMRRNDFVTFQFISQQTNFFAGGAKVEFNQSFSAGYLVRRSGNYFSKNTFKIGLPGASFKFITLYPEVIFHDLFKNFQPGLKLILDLD